jgi:hypothetical protein
MLKLTAMGLRGMSTFKRSFSPSLFTKESFSNSQSKHFCINHTKIEKYPIIFIHNYIKIKLLYLYKILYKKLVFLEEF